MSIAEPDGLMHLSEEHRCRAKVYELAFGAWRLRRCRSKKLRSHQLYCSKHRTYVEGGEFRNQHTPPLTSGADGA